MKTIVIKFGGTSVASSDKLKNIAEIVSNEVKKNKVKIYSEKGWIYKDNI